MLATQTDPETPQLPADTLVQLQLALREQQVILDTAGVGIVFIKQRVLLRCNQRFAQIYGHARPADILGHTSVSLYPDSASFYSLGKAAFAVMVQGLAYKAEVLMKRHTGELFWSHLTGKLVNPADTEEGSIWIIVLRWLFVLFGSRRMIMSMPRRFKKIFQHKRTLTIKQQVDTDSGWQTHTRLLNHCR